MSLPALAVPAVAVPDYLTRPHRAAFPAGIYLILAAADLIFSLIAFSCGIGEGNPIMAWLLTHGLFVSGKIAVSLLVGGLMLIVYGCSSRWRWVVWGGVAIMGAVVCFHLWALPPLLGRSLLLSVP